jgi:hypothetical protein
MLHSYALPSARLSITAGLQPFARPYRVKSSALSLINYTKRILLPNRQRINPSSTCKIGRYIPQLTGQFSSMMAT